MASSFAHEIVGFQVSKLLENRTQSPRFVRHALSVSDVRIALIKSGGEWRFEQQLWRTLPDRKPILLRPDGLLVTKSLPVFIECDLGHASIPKIKEKLNGFSRLAHSKKCKELYGFDTFRLLLITTGSLRARHLRNALPKDPGFEFLCQTFEEVGVSLIPNWS